MPVKLIVRERGPICEGCSYGMVLRGPGTRVVAECRLISARVPTTITSCSRWMPIGMPQIGDYDMSWRLGQGATVIDPRTDKGTGNYA